MTIRINMLSKADSVPGQGVGSAYIEQVRLVEKIEGFEVEVNSPKSDFDIYHIHSVNPSFKMRMNKKHINVMYVHFVPSRNDGSIKLWKPINYLFNKYVESFYKKADELIVVNPEFAEPLISLGIKQENITYIPNYVDKEFFHKIDEEKKKEIRKEYDIPEDKFVVFGCGQIQKRKGFDDFVKVAKDNPDILFVWAGGFSFGRITDGYKEYKQIIKNPPQNLKILGIIPRNKINDVLNVSHVLFMPSYIELFPMTILEAASVGVPILLRDVSLYKPILFDNYLHGTNVEEFTKQIRLLKDDKNIYDKYSKLSEDIATIYSETNLKKIWKDYYLRIFEKHKMNYNK